MKIFDSQFQVLNSLLNILKILIIFLFTFIFILFEEFSSNTIFIHSQEINIFDIYKVYSLKYFSSYYNLDNIFHFIFLCVIIFLD